jgi:hypothetical protein
MQDFFCTTRLGSELFLPNCSWVRFYGKTSSQVLFYAFYVKCLQHKHVLWENIISDTTLCILCEMPPAQARFHCIILSTEVNDCVPNLMTPFQLKIFSGLCLLLRSHTLTHLSSIFYLLICSFCWTKCWLILMYFRYSVSFPSGHFFHLISN